MLMPKEVHSLCLERIALRRRDDWCRRRCLGDARLFLPINSDDKDIIMIALCAIILGFASIWLFDKYPLIWILFVVVGFFLLIWSKRSFPVRGSWAPMVNLKERLARDTTPPFSTIKAIQERYALNKEAKTENLEPYRMREIAKRLIFIDGYLAGKIQGEEK